MFLTVCRALPPTHASFNRAQFDVWISFFADIYFAFFFILRKPVAIVIAFKLLAFSFHYCVSYSARRSGINSFLGSFFSTRFDHTFPIASKSLLRLIKESELFPFGQLPSSNFCFVFLSLLRKPFKRKQNDCLLSRRATRKNAVCYF